MSPLLIRLPEVPWIGWNLESTTDVRESFIVKTFLVTDVKSEFLFNVGETPFVPFSIICSISDRLVRGHRRWKLIAGKAHYISNHLIAKNILYVDSELGVSIKSYRVKCIFDHKILSHYYWHMASPVIIYKLFMIWALMIWGTIKIIQPGRLLFALIFCIYLYSLSNNLNLCKEFSIDFETEILISTRLNGGLRHKPRHRRYNASLTR